MIDINEKIKGLNSKKYMNYNKFKYMEQYDSDNLYDLNCIMSNTIYELEYYEDGFFENIELIKFDNYLLVEFIKRSDCLNFYKDWSLSKFMTIFKQVCDSYRDVYVSIYENSPYDSDPIFFLNMVINLEEYNNFDEIYQNIVKDIMMLIGITENRLRGIWWNSEFEKYEILFCEAFLTPYFNSKGFDDVIFNHGNKEFGKDYILKTNNIFCKEEYYGVQVKAGNLSGSASTDIQEIVNQIDMAFEVPYKLFDGTEIFVSKVIIAISGDFTENAKERIYRKLDRYKFSNIIFIGKHELKSISLTEFP